MKVVVITEHEWRDLKKVRLASLKESPEAFGLSYSEASNFSEKDWKLRASSTNAPRFLIAYDDGDPIGIIGGVFANNEYELIAMWVSPERRGTGVGIELINALKEHAASEGHSTIMLKVSPENTQACGLYKKCGFSTVGMAGSLASNDYIELQKMVWYPAPSLTS